MAWAAHSIQPVSAPAERKGGAFAATASDFAPPINLARASSAAKPHQARKCGALSPFEGESSLRGGASRASRTIRTGSVDGHGITLGKALSFEVPPKAVRLRAG